MPRKNCRSIQAANKANQVSVYSRRAGDFLASRTFTGLEQKLGETKVERAVEGRKGIAKGYTDEV